MAASLSLHPDEVRPRPPRSLTDQLFIARHLNVNLHRSFTMKSSLVAYALTLVGFAAARDYEGMPKCCVRLD